MAHSPTEQEHLIKAHVDSVLFDDSTSAASRPSDHHQVVSRLLHERLTTRFQPQQWPLERLYAYLKTIFEPATTTQDDDAQHTSAAVDATTPPASTPDALTLQLTPRVQRARSCADQLKAIPIWSELILFHGYICSPDPKSESAFRKLASILASFIVDSLSTLSTHIPELRSARLSIDRLASALKPAYDALASRKSLFDSEDQALAFVIVHAASATSVNSSLPEAKDANRHFADQFGRKYRGDAPSRFLEFVARLSRTIDSLDENDQQPYFRGTPIVQSSGTGKTRMVLECRHLTPLLYVCVRPASASGNAAAGYPLPDYGVCDYFEEFKYSGCDLQVACFLGAWFEELTRSLSHCDTVQKKHDLLLQLHRLDRDAGENKQRFDLFTNVVDLATLKVKGADPAVLHHAAIFDQHLRGPLLDLNRQMTLISLYLHQRNQHVAAAAHAPPILVAFDECVAINVRGDHNGDNPLNSLRRAWSYVSGLRTSHKILSFWLVLMSTSSSAAQLVEHMDVKTSIRSKNAAPMPTFVGVGFDELLAEQDKLSCASQAFLHKHIIFYGRPLWVSLLPSRFWTDAIFKLTGAEKFNLYDGAHCFSVMASRLALSLVPTHSSNTPMFKHQKIFSDKAVDSHMRIVKHVTGDAAMHVDSPSEPVLAIAASLVMLRAARDKDGFSNEAQKEALNFYGDVLEHFRQRCLVSAEVPVLKGIHGELASRVVLMAARDAVKRKELDELELNHRRSKDLAMPPPNTADYVAVISRAVHLEDVLSNLANLDDVNLAQIQDRIRAVYHGGLESGRRALQAHGEAAAEQKSLPIWTNFTHFDVLPAPIEEITPEYLWYCWKRGVALQMAHGQPGVDGVIPVFVGHLDEPFFEADATNNGDADIESHAARYMTYIAWEAKNRSDPQTSETDRIKALKFAGPSIACALQAPPQEQPLTERSLISVLFDLGTEVPFASAPRGLQPRSQPITGQSCPRLCIRGVLDANAYPCLDFFGIRTIFRKILSATAETDPYIKLNTMPDPAWNDVFQPKLHSFTTAKQIESQQQVKMDVD